MTADVLTRRVPTWQEEQKRRADAQLAAGREAELRAALEQQERERARALEAAERQKAKMEELRVEKSVRDFIGVTGEADSKRCREFLALFDYNAEASVCRATTDPGHH